MTGAIWKWLKATLAGIVALLALWGVAREMGRKREADHRKATEAQRERRSAQHTDKAAKAGQRKREALSDSNEASERMRRELEEIGERDSDLSEIMSQYNGRRE